jgi:hypothetical protein
MSHRHLLPCVLAVVATVAPAAARAGDSDQDPARSEVSIYGGISILDAHSSQQTTITIPGFPGFPGVAGSSTSPTDVQITTRTKLGNSGLVGARYAFYLRKQLALEADFSVAPSADLRGDVGVCSASRCYGRVDYLNAGSGRSYDAAMNGFFAGPMGRHLRGMEGLQAGEGRPGDGYGFGGRSVTAWHYGGGLVYDVLGGDVRPFVTVGAGGVSYDGTAGAKTNFALRFGGGLKLYFGHLGARVDAVDYLVFDNFLSGRNEHDVHLTGGALVRF